MRVINGRAEDESVGGSRLVNEVINAVDVKDAFFLFRALAAPDAVHNRFGPDRYDFGFYVVGCEDFRHSVEPGARRTVRVAASVEHEYFHFVFSLCFSVSSVELSRAIRTRRS